MSACVMTTTARSPFSRAFRNVSVSSLMSAAVRSRTSSVCSAVSAVLPSPDHGSRPLLLPVMFTALMAIPCLLKFTFSGKPSRSWELIFIGAPSVVPGFGKKVSRTWSSRSSGL
jgi:hypothetical protein